MKSPNRQKGFTLIEMVVVVAIIGVLAGIVIVNVSDKPGAARQVAAKQDIANIAQALSLYHIDNFTYPTSDQGLAALVAKPTLEPIPPNYQAKAYLTEIPRDPWGRPYVYLSPGNHGDFDLYSLGADGVSGGTGENTDITSWKK